MIRPHIRSPRPIRLLAALLLMVPALPEFVLAQAAPGRLVGRVIDASSGQGLSDVGVQVVGTTLGTMSGVDGRYSISNVPAGTVTIQARRIGYQPKTVTGLVLVAGATLEQSLSLSTAAVKLTGVSVTAAAERGSVNAALDRQRTATGVVNSVTAEQIARSPDRDAAQAVQRVSGVTVSEGRYVFVRGLGERYTNTSLNGAALPSPEPERKVVPLDLFPSALLQSVTTSKTFTPDQPGDFTGAQVNIETREFPTQRLLSISSAVGFNTAATGRSIVSAPPTGTGWLGFAGSERDEPTVARRVNSSAFSSGQSQAFVSGLRNVWTPAAASVSPNSSFGASLGGQSAILGHRIGYVGSLSYAYSQEVRADELRQLIVGGGDAAVRAYNSYRGSTGRTSVLWGGIANFSTLVGARSRLSFNNMYNHSSDDEAHLDEGFDEGQSNDPTARTSSVRRSWLDFVERTVRSNQLKGDHALSARQNLDWSLTSSAVSRWQPDRTDVFYVRQQPSDAYFLPNDPKASRRLFALLDESVLTPALNYRLTLGPDERPWQIKVGSQLRDTRRDATLDPYLVTPVNVADAQLEQRPETLFPALVTDGRVSVQRDPSAGSYSVRDRVTAGYGMVEVPVAARVRLIAGARLEAWRLDLRTRQFIGERFDSVYRNTDVLPSLAVNVKLGESQNLRFAATRTLSRPEYRELSPLQEKGPVGELDFVGNPALRRALVNNYDARWEMYPNAGELLSVGVFAKRFDHPIERVQVSTNGGNIYSFVNAEGASNFGLELEARKSLGMLSSRLAPMTAFTNITLMKSTIRPGNSDISALTSADRPMVGQAPYVANAGLTYTSAGGRVSATALYNVVGRRITVTGTKPIPDTYLEPRNNVDFSLQFPVWNSLSAKVNGRNLLDAPYRESAGGLTRLGYRTGRVVSFGLSWTPPSATPVTNP